MILPHGPARQFLQDTNKSDCLRRYLGRKDFVIFRWCQGFSAFRIRRLQNADFKIFCLLGRVIPLKNSCGLFIAFFPLLPILMTAKHTELN